MLLYRRKPLNILHKTGMVYQQQCIDWAAQIQSNNLAYIKSQLPQDMMIASRHALRQVLEAVAQRNNLEVGKSAVLPLMYRGSQQHMDMLRDQIIDIIRVNTSTEHLTFIIIYSAG